MYERFTERARKVMALSNQEAQRFSHEYVGTEHMLLGLLKEGFGVGVVTLKNLDVDLRKLKSDLEGLMVSGPDMVIMGRLPQTPLAKKAIEYAVDYAREIHRRYVGTEHFLVGLMGEEKMLSKQALSMQDLTQEKVKKEIGLFFSVGGEREVRGEPDYWKIPRENVSFEEFLELQGFKISSEKKDPFAILKENPCEQDSYFQIGGCTNKLGQGAFISYDTSDLTLDSTLIQIGFALDLKEVFDINGISYTEKPSSKEVLKFLRGVPKERMRIVSRLEGILGGKPFAI